MGGLNAEHERCWTKQLAGDQRNLMKWRGDDEWCMHATMVVLPTDVFVWPHMHVDN